MEEVQRLVNKVETDVGYLQSGCFDLASVSHFPNKVEGYVDGQIHLKRSQLKRQEQVTLMQLATFANPEFIRKQAMRMPVWNVANLLTAASLTKTELCLPRGILPILEQACQCNLEERFAAVSKMKVKFIGKLRAQQKKALEACLVEQLGIVCAKTGFGKTVLAVAVIAKRQVPTLVIVPTIKLAQQWCDSMLYFLQIESQPWIEKTATGRLVKKSSVEIISGRRNHPARLIDIVTVQKLARISSEKRQELFRHYG